MCSISTVLICSSQDVIVGKLTKGNFDALSARYNHAKLNPYFTPPNTNYRLRPCPHHSCSHAYHNVDLPHTRNWASVHTAWSKMQYLSNTHPTPPQMYDLLQPLSLSLSLFLSYIYLPSLSTSLA